MQHSIQAQPKWIQSAQENKTSVTYCFLILFLERLTGTQ